MRAILLALLVLGTVVAIAPTIATAHEVDCVWGDFNCWTKCQIHHAFGTLPGHQCRWIFYPGP